MSLMNTIQETIMGKKGNGMSMNAIEILKADHDVVEGLFKEVEATENKTKQKALFKKIKAELDVHAHIEEKIFYPRVLKLKEVKDVTLEGIEEHHQAKMFLREIPKLPGGSERFDPKLSVLMEDIRHHVKEEENEMFPKVQDLIEEAELEKIGAAMQAERKKYKTTMSQAAKLKSSELDGSKVASPKAAPAKSTSAKAPAKKKATAKAN
jgi:hemerythrin superfamily protein